MPLFSCRVEGETEYDDYTGFEAYGPKHAAERFAARYDDDYNGDVWKSCGSEIEVTVKGADGVEHKFVVNVEFKKSFHASTKE